MYEMSGMVEREKEQWKVLQQNEKLEKYQKALEAKQKKQSPGGTGADAQPVDIVITEQREKVDQ